MTASVDLHVFVKTVSGAYWPLHEPRPGDVNWRDLGNALARCCLRAGNLAEDAPPYSEAEHACRVADILPVDLRLAGLLHNARKAFVTISDTQKHALDQLRSGAGRAVDRLAGAHDHAIHAAAGLPWPLAEGAAAQVAAAVRRLDATVERDLTAEGPMDGAFLGSPGAPLPTVIVPWPWHKAADEWLARLYRWLPISLASAARREGRL